MNQLLRYTPTIVSGGQTGVDRAALDAAMYLDIPHGGWCPLGRRAEDGVIPDRYQLQETESAAYSERTLANVLAADLTLVLSDGPLHGGTKLTANLAEQHGREFLLADLSAGDDPQAHVTIGEWLLSNHPEVVNVAGPRESGRPGSYVRACCFLMALFRQLLD
jgi:hypothetical protein